MTSPEFAYLDIGNSRAKILIDIQVSFFLFNSSDWINKLELELKKNDVKKVIISSSNPKISNELLKELDEFEFIEAVELLNSFNDLDLNVPGMGTDRKLGLIKAFEIVDLPLITIDTGTALTINFLDDSKKCLGGFILPGLDTQLLSLNSQTSSLPKIEQEIIDFNLGKNTKEAILNGILYGLSGSIKNLIEKSIKELDFKDVNIVITGGNSEVIHHTLKDWNYSITLYNDLVLKGLKVLHNRTMK